MKLIGLLVAGAIMAATVVVVFIALIFPATPNGLDCGSWISPDTAGAVEKHEQVDIPTFSNSLEIVEACDGRRRLHGIAAIGAGTIGALMAVGSFVAIPILTAGPKSS